MKQRPKQNPINHVAFVLDASDSMKSISAELIKVADSLVADLAELSTQLKQETRVTIYVFSNDVECIVYDMDVLRLPSIADFYETIHMTALIDATIVSVQELMQTATLHGDHAFLVYVLTDGQENHSKRNAHDLQHMLSTLPKEWTMACMVPNQQAKFTVVKYGFARDNVAVWDASSEAGVREAGRVMRDSTANYMNARASGLKSTTGLFTMDATAVNHKTVSKLKELTGFRVEPVKQPAVIKPFIEALNLPFITGHYYFPLIKRELVSEIKEILIRHKISGKIYGGPEARNVVGLPQTGAVRISPQPNSEYDVFVQSNSNNRNLIPGHDLLIKV